ncbi:SUZ RNA-binding domain-containing isoform X1 [Anas platyrhynchos]|uniref:SUZ RNA-binding domain-containing isoform X1 n=1 Tax=Anas platyrhynchos TaxID=8839 RepID=UPI003AF2758B
MQEGSWMLPAGSPQILERSRFGAAAGRKGTLCCCLWPQEVTRQPHGPARGSALSRLALCFKQEIDRRLEKKLKITQKESRKSKSPPKVPIVIQDDSLPSGPPPQIRILKRPATNGVLSNPNSATRPAFPVKSLAQREAEYAEARKRILGSASPEEEQEKPILDRPTRISQPEDTRQPNNVIRQPLGPDGSQGFKQRR